MRVNLLYTQTLWGDPTRIWNKGFGARSFFFLEFLLSGARRGRGGARRGGARRGMSGVSMVRGEARVLGERFIFVSGSLEGEGEWGRRCFVACWCLTAPS